MMRSYDDAMAEAVSLGLMTKNGEATDRCQCPTCDAVFSTVGNFDRHRTGGECSPPASVGLIQHEGGWWHMPGPAEDGWNRRSRSHVDGGSRRRGRNDPRGKVAVS
jgi:hypothetical protein